MKSYRNTYQDDKRRYSRFQSESYADVYLPAHGYEQCEIKNMSMCGVYLPGTFDSEPGDTGVLELHGAGNHYGLTLKLRVTVKRVSSEGVALELFDNGEETHVFLQTMLLYCSDDPFSAAQEFSEIFPEAVSALC